MKKIVKLLSLLICLSTLTGCNLFHDHVFEEQVIVKKPTCTEPGEGYLVCKDCGKHSDTIEIEPLDHYYQETVIPATCLEQGYTNHTCLRCGDSYKSDYTEPLGHDYHVYVTDKTCDCDGIEECFCSRCGLDKYEPLTLPHLGHDFVKKVFAPTCIREGYTEYKCKNCNHKTIAQSKDIVDFGCRISNNVKLAIFNCAKEVMSKTMIARLYNVSDNTVQTIFDTALYNDTIYKSYLPEAICIDEFTYKKKTFAFNLCDAKTGKTIDLVEDRTTNNLNKYFSHYTEESRKKVKFVIMDMYTPYIELIKKWFPNAIIIIDLV